MIPLRGSALGVFIAACSSIAPTPLAAQLRPLEAIPLRLLSGRDVVAGHVGAGRFDDQRASLAGTRGALWEVGNFSLAWRTGRVIIEASGTAQRYFREEERFAPALPEVQPSDDGRRHDSGDYRISTTIRLSPAAWPFIATTRFGTRLPTTDNGTGLDRDAVDFFALVGAVAAMGRIRAGAEAGLGIHGTREIRFEQDDLFLYNLRGEYDAGWLVPTAELLGQIHGTGHREIRGVENLGEMRVGIRTPGRYWVRIDFIAGYETFSPSRGWIVSAGLLR